MSSIPGVLRNGLATIVRFLNHPPVKEGVKNITGCASFAFGAIEAYDLYQVARGREISTETSVPSSSWTQTATRVALIAAKISLFLSAATSRIGIFVIGTLAGAIFSQGQLDRLFGPNTTFAQNPWHPRHVLSLGAVLLALPSVIQASYRGACWAYRRVCLHQPPTGQALSQSSPWLTDAKVRLMTLFNTATGRPAQHFGNWLCRKWIRT